MWSYEDHSRGGKRYVLFDKTNSVVEHDTQEEEFEFGLVRKDLSHSKLHS